MTEDEREAFEERAAILEFQAGFQRHVAEQRAMREVTLLKGICARRGGHNEAHPIPTPLFNSQVCVVRSHRNTLPPGTCCNSD